MTTMRGLLAISDSLSAISEIQSWGSERGTFPLNEAELQEAVKAGDLRLGESPFQRAGVNLPVELSVTTSATGPSLRAERPEVG